MRPYITKLNIKGYKPFRDATFELSPLEVIVGANGSGKSSLFEFLRFLRDAVDREIPPEIVKGAAGQQIFHSPNDEKFGWSMVLKSLNETQKSISYRGELIGPKGRAYFSSEQYQDTVFNFGTESLYNCKQLLRGEIARKEGGFNKEAVAFRKLILGWIFFSSFAVNGEKVRRSVLIEQAPFLIDDVSNLSSVLFYLMTDYPSAFQELQFHLRMVIPGFRGLTVKARGGPGEVIAFWKEDGIDSELTLADLSDGIIRLICWITLCVHPNPPSLISIDEPDQGVHPRTLPILADLFKRASERTQILLATHSSYFLTLFDIKNIAVMRKENGEAIYIKPANSKTLMGMLEDFGSEEIEAMHRSDELERLP
jgi:predicted ATPase